MFGTDKIGCYGCLEFQVTFSVLAHWFKRRHLKSKIWIQPIRHTYGMGLRLCELSRGTVLHRRWIHSQTFTPAEQLVILQRTRTKNCRVGKSENFFLL